MGFLENQDQLGVPIGLNFKKNGTYQTQVGGACTLFAFVLVLLLAFTELYSNVILTNFSQVQKTTYLEPAFNDQWFNMTQDQFTIAVALIDRNTNQVANLSSYIIPTFYSDEKTDDSTTTTAYFSAVKCTDLYGDNTDIELSEEF